MRELAFEAKKGMAQERLKTNEEIIAEEKERLESLEAERVKRMTGQDELGVLEEQQEDEFEKEEEEEGMEEESEEDESGDEEDEYSDLEDSGNEGQKKKEKRTTKRVETTTTNKVEEMEEAKKQIPFTFKVPESYEELSGHFDGRDSGEKATILERIIKCNHPQFGDDNR